MSTPPTIGFTRLRKGDTVIYMEESYRIVGNMKTCLNVDAESPDLWNGGIKLWYDVRKLDDDTTLITLESTTSFDACVYLAYYVKDEVTGILRWTHNGESTKLSKGHLKLVSSDISKTVTAD